MNLSPLSWDTDHIQLNQAIRAGSYGIPDAAKASRYPIRLMRYWYMFHLLLEEQQRLGRPLRVCEIGVDSGQMLAYLRSSLKVMKRDQVIYDRWYAVDVRVQEAALRAAGYTEFITANVENDQFTIPDGFDVVIALHVLEHLSQPELAMRRIAMSLRSGALVIGGHPVTPEFFRRRREKRLRARAKPTPGHFPHVSVFSPTRVVQMAERSGCKVDFMSGAFCFRSGGFFAENYPAWFRFNAWFGAMFPSWPGELYWAIRHA
ncbi:MAG: class I SAM-dependent methyltransferase [Pseudomonadota bacterium]|nr:class I SAM-dependent methyltransferase [Pseudomonadota bacterium]